MKLILAIVAALLSASILSHASAPEIVCNPKIESAAGYRVGELVLNDYVPGKLRLMQILCFSNNYDGVKVGLNDSFYDFQYIEKLVNSYGRIAIGDTVETFMTTERYTATVTAISQSGKLQLNGGNWVHISRVVKVSE